MKLLSISLALRPIFWPGPTQASSQPRLTRPKTGPRPLLLLFIICLHSYYLLINYFSYYFLLIMCASICWLNLLPWWSDKSLILITCYSPPNISCLLILAGMPNGWLLNILRWWGIWICEPSWKLRNVKQAVWNYSLKQIKFVPFLTLTKPILGVDPPKFFPIVMLFTNMNYWQMKTLSSSNYSLKIKHEVRPHSNFDKTNQSHI